MAERSLTNEGKGHFIRNYRIYYFYSQCKYYQHPWEARPVRSSSLTVGVSHITTPLALPSMLR